eukprot:g8144.t1
MSSPVDVFIDLVDKLLSGINEVKINRESCELLARKVRSTLGIVLQLDDASLNSSVVTALELVKDALKEAQETINNCCQTSLFSSLLYHKDHDIALNGVTSKLENACAQIALAQAEIYSDLQTELSDLPHQLNHIKFGQTAAMAHQVQELREVLEKGFFQERKQMAEVKELVQKVITKHLETREEIKAQIDLLTKEILGARKDKEALMEFELNEVITAMHQSMKATSRAKDRLQDFKDGLLCPISKDIMEDPVILKETGNTYDRSSIQEWFELGHSKDPLTNVKVSSKELLPDLVLQDVCLALLGKSRKSTNASGPHSEVLAPPIEPGVYEGYGKCKSDTSTLLVQQMIIFEPNGEVTGCSFYKSENTQKQNINLQIGNGHWNGESFKLYYKDNWYNFSGNIDLTLIQGEYILKWNGKMNTRRGHPETNDSAFLYRPPFAIMSNNLHPGIYQLENAFFTIKENITYKAKVMVSLHSNWNVEGWMWLKATGPYPNFEARIEEGKWSSEGSMEFNVVFEQRKNPIESQTEPTDWSNGFEFLGNITQDESSHFSFTAKVAKKSYKENIPNEELCYVPLKDLDSLEFLCIREASTPWNHTHQDPLKVVQVLKNCEVKLVEDIINTIIQVNLGLFPYNQAAMNRASIYIASQQNSIDIFKVLISNGASVQSQDKKGWTLLHLASYYNSTNVINDLIANVTTIEPQDNDGWTPLHLASQNNSIDTVKVLIANGASVELQNKDGLSSLHFASQNNSIDVVKELIANGANIELQDMDGNTALHIGSLNDSIDVVKELIANCATIDIQNKDGASPLHFASQQNNVDIVKELITNGANINLENINGESPLHIASQHNYVDIAKELIANGANIELQNKDGSTPLHIASQHNSSPLYIASQNNSIDVAKELIAHGANIDLQNKNGASPLYIASQNNSIDVAKELIAHGANIDLQEKDGVSPLWIASQFNSIDVAKELIAHGVNINLQNKNGWTSLHIALWFNSIDVSKELIANGVNFNQQTFDGLTPLHIASICGRVSIVKVDIQRRSNLLYSFFV